MPGEKLLLPVGTKLLKSRRAAASPLEMLTTARKLPEMRPLEYLGPDLYPASGLKIPPREYRPGAVYPDEVRAIESVLPSLREDIQAGVDAGYDKWYYMGPMQEFFRSQWGKQDVGDREFRRAMGLASASSNATPVPQEVKKGSLLYYLHHQGMLPRAASYDEAIRRVRQARESGLIPPGYGGFAQAQDLNQVSKFLDGNRLGFPVEMHDRARYKIGDYYNPKIGDLDTGAMDSHIHNWLGLPFETRTYATARQAIAQAGGDIPLGRSQPALWIMRGARTPEFDSVAQPSLMHWYEAAAQKRAAQTGDSPEDVLRKWVKGKEYLAAMLPFGAATAGTDTQED